MIIKLLIFSRASITREGENEPVQLKLSDDGRGADLTEEDGIYSAYFIDYTGVTGRYTLECEVLYNFNIDRYFQ